MDKIYYVGFFGDALAYEENRHLAPSGVNKMDYIARAMGSEGMKIKIISTAWLKYKKNLGLKITRQRKFKVTDNVDCVLPYSITLPLKISTALSMFLAKVWLILYFLINIGRNDIVIVYHSTFYLNTLYWLKKIINFKLILEVEEVYSIVFSMDEKWKRRENRLINFADSYIFPNDLMYDYLGIKNKKQVVVYGSYLIQDTDNISFEFGDDKIHLVYAGVIDKLKLGAFNAVYAAKYLPDNYVLHILGFGAEKDVEDLQDEIQQINRFSECKIVYEGKKTGEDYFKFMRKCHIGLSTQKNEGEYLKLTFPSKVLGYLTIGLNVVSAKIEGVMVSDIGDIVAHYNEDSPQAIAEAIKNIKILSSDDIKGRIAELDAKFKREIKEVLNNSFYKSE